MKNHNIYIYLGILFNSSFLFLNRFNTIPDFIKGLFVGLGIGLMIIGLYSKHHNLSKSKIFKHDLFNKIFEQ